MSDLTWVNGVWEKAGGARLSVTDLGIQRGYGIFDFFRVVEGEPVFLEDHLQRFFRSAATMRLPINVTAESLEQLVGEIIDRNQLQEGGIKLLLTGGNSPDGYSIGNPNFVISAVPLLFNRAPGPPLRLMSLEHARQLPGVKTIDYLMAIWMQPRLQEAGVQDILYHKDGKVAECPRANFFIVSDNGEVYTPKTGVLAGITRKKLLETDLPGIRAVERDFGLQEAKAAAEAFVTSSTKQVYPVGAIDGEKIGSGEMGPVTRRLSDYINGMVFASSSSI